MTRPTHTDPHHPYEDGVGSIIRTTTTTSPNMRLVHLRAAISKLTLEATRSSRPYRTAKTEDPTAPSTPSNSTGSIDPNASFHLGMELFGQDVAHTEGMMLERLQALERDLEDIKTLSGSENDAPEYHSLTQRLQFLSECSNARIWLDESLTLSTPVLASSERPNLVASSRKLVTSQQAARRAADIGTQPHEPDETVSGLTDLLHTIRAEQRRQKLDLTAQAIHILTHAFTVTSYAIVVSSIPETLSSAYDVLIALAEDDTQATAYVVTPLEATLRLWTRNLQKEIWGPVIDEIVYNTNIRAPQKMRIFLESETGIKDMLRGGTGTIGSQSSGRRLEWTTAPRNHSDAHLEQNEATSRIHYLSDAWKEALSFLQRTIAFIADHLLLQRGDLCHMMALRLFGKPVALPNALNLELLGIESCRLGDDNGLLLVPLVETLEQTCVPNYLRASELGQLKLMAEAMGNALKPFVIELTDKRMLPEESKTRFSHFTESLEQLYVDNRRCFLLNELRAMLLNNDYHNTVVVGEIVNTSKDDEALGIPDAMAVFKLHQASISDTASKLMEHCRRALDEAVEQQVAPNDSALSFLPATLYRTAREMLDLFRAVIPVQNGREVASVPRTAAVLHNDCVFLSHHCLTLGLEYKEKFPEPLPDDTKGNLLRRMCVFVDMVPLFRDLADRSLGDMLDVQAQELSRLVGERIALMGEALRSEEILAEWSDAETAMNTALYHLRHLSQTWKPILSTDMLNRSLCYLIDVTLTLFLDQVAKASDISSSACSFVYTLFEKATHDLQLLLGDNGRTSDSREWDRFSAVGRFMDMSIADIEVALSDGLFRSVTGPELARLVTSCFDDTPKRRALLKIFSNNP